MNYLEEANKKLETEEKNIAGSDRKVAAMKGAVKKALKEFCAQSAALAEAVCKGRSFEECMKAVAKDANGSISDMEAYKRAVRFYLPGADIRFRMEIIGADDKKEENKAGNETRTSEIIDLYAFF